jgi:hypothetical protein
MRARLSIVTISGLLLAAACGGEPVEPDTGPSVTRVDPSSPRGTVWGAVVAARDHSPLSGATVILSAAEEIHGTQTDADGLFVFEDVPAGGEVGVTISLDGHTRATLRVMVPGEAGDFPAEGIGAFVGPVALFPLDGTVTIQLVGYDGRPVDGAEADASVRAAWVDLDGGTRLAGLVATTATSASGTLSFSGLPNLSALAHYDASLTFTIGPVVDDGVVRYLGAVETRAASWLVSRGGQFSVTLDPPGEDAPLDPIGSNVGSLLNGGLPRSGDSVIGVNEAIRVAFNQPVDARTLEARVFDHSGENYHPSTAQVENGNVVRIAPDGETYVSGRGYRVTLSVHATGTTHASNRVDLVGNFYATPQDQEVKVVNVTMDDVDTSGTLNAGDEVRLELSQSIGRGDGEAGYMFPVYFNLDLNQSGSVGDGPGELGSDEPIWAYEDEPSPPAPLVHGGFTRYFVFTMPNVPNVNYDPIDNPGAAPYAFTPGVGIDFRIDLSSGMAGYRLMDPRGKPVSTPSALESATIAF